MRPFYRIIFLILATASACTEQTGNNNQPTDAPATADSTGPTADSAAAPARDTTAAIQPTPSNPNARHTYHFIHPKDSAGKAFLKSLSKEQLQIVYALNRVDAGPARRTDTLVIPDAWEADLMAYAPYPAEVPALAGVKKIIFFSYPIQAFGVYEGGRLVRWGPTSMGKKATPTPTGLFFSNWKSKEIRSTSNDEWILKWNFNVSNSGGVGWHQYDLPGYPASHSCMRLYAYDAQWLYTWADQWRLSPDGNTVELKGTPCVIFGAYTFGALKPWRRLVANGDDNDISVEALTAEVEKYLPKIMEAQQARDAAPPPAPRAVASGATAADSSAN